MRLFTVTVQSAELDYHILYLWWAIMLDPLRFPIIANARKRIHLLANLLEGSAISHSNLDNSYISLHSNPNASTSDCQYEINSTILNKV